MHQLKFIVLSFKVGPIILNNNEIKVIVVIFELRLDYE